MRPRAELGFTSGQIHDHCSIFRRNQWRWCGGAMSSRRNYSPQPGRYFGRLIRRSRESRQHRRPRLAASRQLDYLSKLGNWDSRFLRAKADYHFHHCHYYYSACCCYSVRFGCWLLGSDVGRTEPEPWSRSAWPNGDSSIGGFIIYVLDFSCIRGVIVWLRVCLRVCANYGS